MITISLCVVFLLQCCHVSSMLVSPEAPQKGSCIEQAPSPCFLAGWCGAFLTWHQARSLLPHPMPLSLGPLCRPHWPCSSFCSVASYFLPHSAFANAIPAWCNPVYPLALSYIVPNSETFPNSPAPLPKFLNEVFSEPD